MSFLSQANAWEGVPIGEHLVLFSPMIALIVTMLGVMLCPILVGRSTRPTAIVAALGVGVTFLLTLLVASKVTGGGISGLSPDASSGMLIADNLSAGFQILLIGFLAAVMVLWWIGSSASEKNAPEFFILLLGSALGMALMVSTSNLLMIVIAIEVASLPSYAMVGFDKRDRVAAEASLKYMIFGAISAAIMIFGASLLYGLVGSLDVSVLASYVTNNLTLGSHRVVLAVALLFFMAGIAFKISAAPFHFWCPDAFQGAKIEVATWLSVASKAAGLILLVRLVSLFCEAVPRPVQLSSIAPLAWAIGLMAAVTCTLGNLSAYKQQSVKRLLAYSSIAHAGYMMMAAAVFIHPSRADHMAGMSALLVYIVIYVFMNLGAFGVTAMVIWDTGTDDLSAFSGLIRRAPWLAVPMILCLMSLVGLPPLAGFIGKWWVLVSLGSLTDASGGQSGSLSTLGWLLVVVTAFNTLISLFYYLRVVVKMTLQDDGRSSVRASLGGIVMVNGCAAALLALFLFANPLRATADRFTRDLFHASPAARSVATAIDGAH